MQNLLPATARQKRWFFRPNVKKPLKYLRLPRRLIVPASSHHAGAGGHPEVSPACLLTKPPIQDVFASSQAWRFVGRPENCVLGSEPSLPRRRKSPALPAGPTQR